MDHISLGKSHLHVTWNLLTPCLFIPYYGLQVTNDSIGAVENLVATAWVGIVYSLIGEQPVVSFDKKAL
jgi:hypothetical protein